MNALDVLTCKLYVAAPETSVQSNVRDAPGAHRAPLAGDSSVGAESWGGTADAGDRVRVAVRVTPPWAAAMVTDVDVETAVVAMVKVALVAPAGTVTVAGTVAAGLLLARSMTAPPGGAAALSVTVAVDDPLPPVTVLGERPSPETASGPGVAGSTVRDAERVEPP